MGRVPFLLPEFLFRRSVFDDRPRPFHADLRISHLAKSKGATGIQSEYGLLIHKQVM